MKASDKIPNYVTVPKPLNALQEAALRLIKERDMVDKLTPEFPEYRTELMAHIIVSHLDGNYDSDLDFLDFGDMKDLHDMMPHQNHTHGKLWYRS